jgi:anhydro-N-acetylmuramic acid kinase
MNRHLYIGLISGTSMDGVDCVLADIHDSVHVIDQLSLPIPDRLKADLLSLCRNTNLDFSLIGRTNLTLAHLFADAVQQVLARNKLEPGAITAIGSHGQTVWHEPPRDGKAQGFTVQLCDPNTLVERTGITTVADIRGMDMAAGGQGAPLVPAFHKHMFQQGEENLAVLNLGGIANVTLIPADGSTPGGFDTGPASVLMDGWIARHMQKAFDASGSWAASGRLNDGLLVQLLEENYFQLPAPKSTGRELFNAEWLDSKLANCESGIPPADVQRTLLELTAVTVSEAIKSRFKSGRLVVCGGGAGNSFLLERLNVLLPDFSLDTSSIYGIHPDFVEAAAFAWFAKMRLGIETVDFPPFTGARQRVVSGAIYQARDKPRSNGK